MTSTTEETFDLVVIGGGPTGLLCAVLARQLGLTVSIIEAKACTLESGRADGLNARTQQYLGVIGTLDKLRPNGIQCNTTTTASSTFADGAFETRQSHWWTSIEHCQHKNMLIIGQPAVERALLAQLQAPRQPNVPLAIRFRHRAKSIVEDDSGVKVISEGFTEHGVPSRVTTRAQFAIGADGARSTIRPLLGFGFEGSQPEMVWAVLDTWIDTDFPTCPEIISLQNGGQCRVLWVPRERRLSRFYVRLLPEEVATKHAAEETIREHMSPYRVRFLRAEWFIKERVASAFATLDGKGRVFLAGDAAHCHSVNGAQGLNTGVADAFGLIWRIAIAAGKIKMDPSADAQGHNHGGQDRVTTIMKSYDTERRAVALNAVGVAAELVRDTRHHARQYVATIERNAGYITGMGVAYDGMGSPLVVESEQGIWKAGRRCPDLEVQFASPHFPGPTRDTYRLYETARSFGYGRFLLLVIGHHSHAAPTLDWQFRSVANAVTLVWPGAILSLTDPNKAPRGGFHYPGEWSFVTDAVGPDDSFMVVVRPDLYIGYVGDIEGLLSYMAKIFS
ncbi:FAD monooxygenase [Apiospora marii]|uniref:FAD monooxygenase n=1 Tax=Apiospora marii TaxID=335849 RepID=UPI0031320CC4